MQETECAGAFFVFFSMHYVLINGPSLRVTMSPVPSVGKTAATEGLEFGWVVVSARVQERPDPQHRTPRNNRKVSN